MDAGKALISALANCSLSWGSITDSKAMRLAASWMLPGAARKLQGNWLEPDPQWCCGYLHIIEQRDHGIKLFLGDTQLMRTDRKLAVNGVHDFKGFTGTGAAREFCLPGFTNREGRWGEGRFAAVR